MVTETDMDTLLTLFAAVVFHPGPTNTVLVGPTTAVYGVPAGAREVSHVLLTHARRDTFGAADPKAGFVVPASERDMFANPGAFWSALETGRFHDYAQQSTKTPITPLKISQAVSDGDVLQRDGARIRIISTPGYTRGAVSYLIESDGKRIACTGDLIYGDGQLFDLYSLQDAVPEAKARGYHGYAARAGALIESLRKIKAEKPDTILPARGPAIHTPAASIDRLIQRLQTFLASHFETDALRWYWGDENHRIRSRAVEKAMDIMPMAEQAKLPPDIIAIGNSRLIVSSSKAAFLVDAGYSKLLPELRRLRAEGRIQSIEGIWITHYHDDHTDYVNDVAAEFGAPVYFTQPMTEVLAKPGAFRLPCLTLRPIPTQGAKRDGDTMSWREWQLTFWHFPGQTLYHGGLVAKRGNGETFLFTGDSFTPSGMDDYCMQNRDFLREGEGYSQCLRKMKTLPQGAWMLNQHVEPLFRYTPAQIERMRSELADRSEALKTLSPWPDINYMVDESWARIHPYGREAAKGETVEFELRILNHAPTRMKYDARWHVPAGWTLLDAKTSVTLAARQEGSLRARMRAGAAGLHIVTTDISFAGRQLNNWTEALVRVR